MSVNLNDIREHSHRLPFWNWEDNTKDLSKVDKIRLKYFEGLTNNFWDCTQLWWKLVNMSVNFKWQQKVLSQVAIDACAILKLRRQHKRLIWSW